jgi:L-cystine transport system ATP-binding protein
MFEVKGVCKAFGQNEVLKGVDIKVNKSDVIVIIGPSGSGKTTLLRCIIFLERADAGELIFEDRVYSLKKRRLRIFFKYAGKPHLCFRAITFLTIKRRLKM